MGLGSGIRKKPVPDPGVKKAPGSGSATLLPVPTDPDPAFYLNAYPHRGSVVDSSQIKYLRRHNIVFLKGRIQIYLSVLVNSLAFGSGSTILVLYFFYFLFFTYTTVIYIMEYSAFVAIKRIRILKPCCTALSRNRKEMSIFYFRIICLLKSGCTPP